MKAPFATVFPLSRLSVISQSIAGKIGIGTAAPAAKLEVFGDWTGQDGALRVSGDKPTIRFTGGSTAGNQSWIIHQGINGPGNLEFYRRTGQTWGQVMSLTPAGNIGIGTSNPQAKLHLAGGDLLSGAAGEEWIFHTRSHAGGDFLHITDRDSGTPQFRRGLVLNDFGRVGIGTTTPQALLDVRGDIRLGSSGQYRATSGEENLRIIRGVVDGAGNIIAGSGFQVSHGTEGLYTITFNTSFAGPPAMTAVAEHSHETRTITTAGVTSSAANLRTYFVGQPTDVTFHFIAIGPR